MIFIRKQIITIAIFSHIITIIGHAIKQGLPNDWLMNWTKPKFKSSDKNQVSNYCTITIGHLVKLRVIMEESRPQGKTLLLLC